MKYRSRLFNFNRSTPLPKQIYIRYCTTICDAVSEPSRERFNSLVKKCSRILFRVYALFDSFTEMRCAECSRLFPTFVRWLAFFPVTLWDMISYKVTTPTFVILTHLQWSMNIQLWVFFTSIKHEYFTYYLFRKHRPVKVNVYKIVFIKLRFGSKIPSFLQPDVWKLKEDVKFFLFYWC